MKTSLSSDLWLAERDRFGMQHQLQETKTVILLNASGRGGTAISKKVYEMVVVQILSLLFKNGETRLTDFLSQVKIEQRLFKGDVHWLLLQMKADLEARGLIKCTFKNKRVQTIRLVMKSVLKSQFRNQVISEKVNTDQDERFNSATF